MNPFSSSSYDLRNNTAQQFDRAVRLPVRLPKNSDFTQPFVCQKNGIWWSRSSARSSAKKLRFFRVIRLSVRPPKTHISRSRSPVHLLLQKTAKKNRVFFKILDGHPLLNSCNSYLADGHIYIYIYILIRQY